MILKQWQVFYEVDPYHYPNNLVVSGMVSAIDFSADHGSNSWPLQVYNKESRNLIDG